MRAARYALVLLLALEIAVWEAFLVAARPFGTPLPLAAALAAGGNLALCRAGAVALGDQRGAYGPSLVWLLVAMPLALPGPLGDLVVPGTGRGVAYLVAGMVTAVAGALWRPGTHRAAPATPGAGSGR